MKYRKACAMLSVCVMFVAGVLFLYGSIAEQVVEQTAASSDVFDNQINPRQKDTKVYTMEEIEDLEIKTRHSSLPKVMEEMDFTCLRITEFSIYGLIRAENGTLIFVTFDMSPYDLTSEKYLQTTIRGPLWMVSPDTAEEAFGPFLNGNFVKIDDDFFSYLVNRYQKYRLVVSGTNYDITTFYAFSDGIVYMNRHFLRNSYNVMRCKFFTYEEFNESGVNDLDSAFISGDVQKAFHPSIGSKYDGLKSEVPTGLSVGETENKTNEREIVIFGSYEQDGNAENGKEPIEWIVLDKEDDTCLLLSKYALNTFFYCDIDCDPWTDVDYSIDVDWEMSKVREWLNGKFMEEAFTQEEMERIRETEITVEEKSNLVKEYHVLDSVFLLSAEEAEKYLEKPNERICIASEYAKSRHLNTGKGDVCWWWLRTKGEGKLSAAFIRQNGEIDIRGHWVDLGRVIKDAIGVRPAIVLKTAVPEG